MKKATKNRIEQTELKRWSVLTGRIDYTYRSDLRDWHLDRDIPTKSI